MRKIFGRWLVLCVLLATILFFFAAPFSFRQAGVLAPKVGSFLLEKGNLPVNVEVIWNSAEKTRLDRSVTLIEKELKKSGWQEVETFFVGEYIAGYCAIEVLPVSAPSVSEEKRGSIVPDQDRYELYCFIGTAWKNPLASNRMRIQSPEQVLYQINRFTEKIVSLRRQSFSTKSVSG